VGGTGLTRGKVGVFVLALLASPVVGAALWRGLNPPGIPVKTVKAEEKLFEDKILATGKVEVAKEVTVASVKGAKVEKILVREGEEVGEGQVLALLDLREEINTWQDKVRAAEAALGVAEAELASLKQVRPEELEQLEAELKAAREQLQEIQAGLENARRKLERYRFLRDQGALSPADEYQRGGFRLPGDPPFPPGHQGNEGGGGSGRIRPQGHKAEAGGQGHLGCLPR